MPEPRFRFPASIDPKNASVLDSTLTQVLRRIAAALASGEFQQAALGSVDIPGTKNPNLRLGQLIRRMPDGSYRLIPESQERVLAAIEAGRKRGGNWDVLDPRVGQAAGGDPLYERQLRRAHAATMPNTDIVTSTAEALRAQALAREGHPLSMLNLGQEGITMLGAKAPNLNRAFADQPLSGPKIRPMGEYMLGKDQPVWDVHALDTVGVEGVGQTIDAELPALRQYVYAQEGIGRGMPVRKLEEAALVGRADEALLAALRELAPDMTPNRSFATMWEGMRGIKGEPNVGGWIDLLQRGGALEPGAMLSPEQLREASRVLAALRTGPRR
jgi:hypothetical protein